MNFFIRTNYDSSVGLGHFSRSCRLAKYLISKNHSITMILDYKKDLDNFFINKKNNKIKFKYLYKKKVKKFSQLNDANLFLKILNKRSIVIVDDIRLSFLWEKKIKSKIKKMISFEDTNNRIHYSDIVINSKPEFLDTSNYKKLNKQKNSVYLLGPRFSVIKKVVKKTINSKRKSKIISFYNGGAGDLEDIYNIIFYLNKIYKKKIIVNVIMGPLCKKKEKIYHLKKRFNNIRIFENSSNFDNVLLNTDLLVTSSGMFSLEASFYKIPTLCYQVSADQFESDKYLDQLGRYFSINKRDYKEYKKVTNLIILMLNNLRILNLNFKPLTQIYSQGMKNIYDFIVFKKKIQNQQVNKKNDKLKLIRVDHLAINKYLQFRNLIRNRFNSSSRKKINKVDHYCWWLKNKHFIFSLKLDDFDLAFIRNQIFKLDNINFCINSFVSSDTVNGSQILWGLKKNLDYLKKSIKNLVFVIFVKKNNKFGNLNAKFLKLNPYDNKNKILNKLLKEKFSHSNNHNIYVS